MTTSNSSLVCPRCGQMDRVEKVTAIVAGQVHSIKGTTYSEQVYVDGDGRRRHETFNVPYSGMQASLLAQNLLPPPRPRPASFPLVLLFSSLLLVLVLIPCLVGTVLFLTVITPRHTPETIQSAMGVVIAIEFVAPLAIIHVYMKKRRAAQIQPEIEVWQQAMERWNQLYFCSRDDVVFVPGENLIVPTSQMMDYIYS